MNASGHPEPAGSGERFSPFARRSAALLAFSLATALYLPSSGNPLVWDDELHVSIVAGKGLAAAFDSARDEYRRPLVLLSYAAQAGMNGPLARDLHLANAAMHGANAALLVSVVVAAGGTVSVALASALLFAFHPLASGSVAYISGRTDLLAVLFTLLAVRLALAPPGGALFSGAGGVPSAGMQRASLRSVALAAAIAAAVAAAGLSKESGILAGPLVAAVLWWRRAGCAEPVPPLLMFLPLLASAAVAAFVMPPAVASAVPVELRFRGAGTALLTYAQLLVRPAGMHLDRLTPVGGGAAITAGALFVVASIGTAAAFVRRPSAPTFLGVCLLMAYAPASGLVPVYPAIADRLVFTGEQLLYGPLAVLGVCVAAGVAWLGRSPAVLPLGVAVLVSLAWTPSVVLRQREFASAEQVYRKTLAHSPSPRACVNLGNLQFARRAVEAAMTTYEACVRMAPNDGGLHGQLAVALQKLGYVEDARREYELAIELDDTNALVWSNFATLDANAGRYADARTKWNRALTLDPEEETARAALARLDAAHR